MKSNFLSLAIMLFIVSCRKEPAPPATPPIILDTTPAISPNWQKSTSGLKGAMNFYFITAAKGFSAASGGIYRTTDSGKTWKAIHKMDYRGSDVFFSDKQHGCFIIGEDFGVTADGGDTWNVRQHNFTTHEARRVFFTTAATGFITTESGLFKTEDGGETWSRTASKGCAGIYFANDQNRWIGTSGGLFKTADGGHSFVQAAPAYSRQAYAINFVDSLHGWATNTGSSAGAIQYTIDGGATWTRILEAEKQSSLVEVFFIDEHTGWAGDLQGNTYRWND